MRDDDDPSLDEPVEQPIEDSIDLHYFRPSECADLVREYLRAAYEEGFRTVRIIHGKGTSQLKRRVESVLAKHPSVKRYYAAPPHLGGWGATMVDLGENAFDSEAAAPQKSE